MDATDVAWDRFRSLMPVTRKWAYFDHAAVAPLPEPTVQTIHSWAAEAACEGDTVWARWVQRTEDARQLAAELIGADPGEIALVGNTTTAITLVAEGLAWEPGDNVVLPDNEFPSNVYPWLNLNSRGVEVRRVAVDEGRIDWNRIAEACDARTRVVSVSWVGYATGYRIDVGQAAEVAHDQGALLLLDAIQGLGVFPLDVRASGVDFVAADGHKWMLGPEGMGLLYLRQEHLPQLRPLGVGWNSVVHHHDYSKIQFDLRPTAARYEGGSQNMVGAAALGASLRVLADFGLSASASAVGDRIVQLTDDACERLSALGATICSNRQSAHRSGIVSFEFPGQDPGAVRRQAHRAGVALNCRAGRLRISPHAYGNEADLERLVESLASMR